MKLTYTVRSALNSLKVHKMRSLLTILGIIIGIAAIILVASIGKGAQNLILSQVESLGSKTIAVAPGREPTGPADPSIIEVLYSDSLKTRELEALSREENVPNVETIMPVVNGVETVSYQGETFRPTILGGTELISSIFNIYPTEGRFITEEDVKSRSSSVVIGVRVKEELFGDSSPIGEKIRIKDRNYEVVGVLPQKGQVVFFNFDETVLLPYTTAQQYVFGIKHFNRIILQAETEEDIPRIVEDIEITLRSLHNITDPEQDDFFVGTQAEITDTFKTVTDTLTIFLSSVAAIALVVGGIGIMNIMLVSVTQRTREIGLRKSIGATNKNIMIHFLLEASTLTTVGGVIGIVLGSFLSFIVALVLAFVVGINWTFAFPITAAIIGVAVSIIIGLVFGLYPAYKASRESPIEALRYE